MFLLPNHLSLQEAHPAHQALCGFVVHEIHEHREASLIWVPLIMRQGLVPGELPAGGVVLKGNLRRKRLAVCEVFFLGGGGDGAGSSWSVLCAVFFVMFSYFLSFLFPLPP